MVTTSQQHSRISILADDLNVFQTVDTTQKRMLEGYLGSDLGSGDTLKRRKRNVQAGN